MKGGRIETGGRLLVGGADGRAIGSGLFALVKEAEKFDALAQAALHHFGAAHHAADEREDLPRTEIKLAVELLDRIEDQCCGEGGIAKCSYLHAMRIDQFTGLDLEPSLFLRLTVKFRAGIRRRERHLDRLRLDIAGKANGFANRLGCFAGQPENKRAMNGDAQLPAIAGEFACDVDAGSLLDVIQDLLNAGFVADEQQPQAIVTKDLQSFTRNIRFSVARPDYSETAQALCDFLGAREIIGESVIIKEKLSYLREVFLGSSHFGFDAVGATHAIAMSTQGLRPKTESAFRTATPARIEGHIRMLEIADEVVFDGEIALIDLDNRRQSVHIFDGRPRASNTNLAVVTIGDALNLSEWFAGSNFGAGVVELAERDPIHRRRAIQRLQR